MVNNFQAHQLIIFIVHHHHEVQTGVALVNDLAILPLQKVAQLALPRLEIRVCEGLCCFFFVGLIGFMSIRVNREATVNVRSI
jgi:hypothetical protein